MKAQKLYVDQYGYIFHASTLKELKEQIPGRVSIMYCDDKEGNTYRIGYVIGNHWLNCYEPMRIKVQS